MDTIQSGVIWEPWSAMLIVEAPVKSSGHLCNQVAGKRSHRVSVPGHSWTLVLSIWHPAWACLTRETFKKYTKNSSKKLRTYLALVKYWAENRSAKTSGSLIALVFLSLFQLCNLCFSVIEIRWPRCLAVPKPISFKPLMMVDLPTSTGRFVVKFSEKKCVFSSVVCCLDLHLNLSLFVCICIICQPSSIGQTHHHQHKTSIFQISKVVKWRKGHPYPSDAICQRTKGSRMLCPRMFQGKVFDLHQVPVLRCCC